MHILLAEDDAVIADAICTYLGTQAMQVAKITQGTVQAKALNQSEISAKRLQQLIDDLLLLARIESTA